MIADSIKAQLEEAEQVMRRQMARIAELEAQVEDLKAADAHNTLKSIYADSNQPTGHRIRAAQAALQCETPRLESIPPAVDATCEVIEPLADVVRRQRARADRMLAEQRNITVLPNGQVLVIDDEGNSGNGSDSTAG